MDCSRRGVNRQGPQRHIDEIRPKESSSRFPSDTSRKTAARGRKFTHHTQPDTSSLQAGRKTIKRFDFVFLHTFFRGPPTAAPSHLNSSRVSFWLPCQADNIGDLLQVTHKSACLRRCFLFKKTAFRSISQTVLKPTCPALASGR